MKERNKKMKKTNITGYDIRITWNNGDKEWLSELEDYYFKDVDNYLDSIEEEHGEDEKNS